MTNAQIADNFSLLSKLMDIHGENSFKLKNYSVAAFAIDKLPMQLAIMEPEKIPGLKNIGASTAQKIFEMLNFGKLQALEDIILKTPPGIVEMLHIKGLGPKKINTIWKEMDIESIGELLYACRENRLKLYKGFGEKTQQNILESVEFYQQNSGSHLYAEVEEVSVAFLALLRQLFPGKNVSDTGALRMRSDTVSSLDFVIDAQLPEIETTIAAEENFTLVEKGEDNILYQSAAKAYVKLFAAGKNFWDILLKTSSSEILYNFLTAKQHDAIVHSEQDYFTNAGVMYLPPTLRESQIADDLVIKGGILPDIIKPNEVKGIVHCHSNWSDGNNTIEEMATAAIEQGYEYIVISDHSKSAAYANGLFENRIREQHLYIDELNKKFAPFKIFKSIESDILGDGSLDYPDDVLATFDLVIASVHSNLKMTEEKAMMRLMKAIENPYTTILGHPTGRLLLSRNGYPVNHEAIIEACVANNVVIELNANPHRLDIDWRYIHDAVEKGALISINPDSHSTNTFFHIKYGVYAAQKALLTKERNLSSFSLADFEKFLAALRQKKGIC